MLRQQKNVRISHGRLLIQYENMAWWFSLFLHCKAFISTHFASLIKEFTFFARNIVSQFLNRETFGSLLGLIRVDPGAYPPPTRPLEPLPDPYPTPRGYLIGQPSKTIKKYKFTGLKSLNFFPHVWHLKGFAAILCSSMSFHLRDLNFQWKFIWMGSCSFQRLETLNWLSH